MCSVLSRAQGEHTLGEHSMNCCLHPESRMRCYPSPYPPPERIFLDFLLSPRKCSCAQCPKRASLAQKVLDWEAAYHDKPPFQQKKEQIYSLVRQSTGSSSANISLITCPFVTTLDCRNHDQGSKNSSNSQHINLLMKFRVTITVYTV